MRIRGMTAAVVVAVLVPAMAFGFTAVFRAAYTEIGASYPTGVAAGDFDLDGNVDAVTTNASSSNQLTPFIGFGDGTLSQVGVPIDLGSVPSALVKGRFDGDEIDDVIVARGNENSIVFLKGLGDPDFFAPPGPSMSVGQGPVGLTAADFTGDGILDLAVANEGSDSSSSPGSVSFLRGIGDGTFVRLVQVDPADPEKTVDDLPADFGTRAVAIGNIDADPALDVVAVNARSNTLSIYTGDGQGVFTPREALTVGASPQDVVLADLNNDGRLDLVLALGNQDEVSVRLGNGDGTFADPQAYQVGNTPNRLAVDDLNGDGLLDIVVTNRRSGDLSVLLATAPGVFAAARTFVADSEPEAVTVGDLNNDDVLDVITANQGSESGATVAVLTHLGNGNMHAVEDIPAGAGPSDVAVADVDGDGAPDMIVGADGGAVRIYYGTATGFRGPTLLDIGGRVLSVAAADLNGDTLPDLVAVDGENNRVAVVLSRGAGRFAPEAVYATAPGPTKVTIGDFNGDGRPDIAVSAVSGDRICQGGPRTGQSCLQQNDCSPGGVCAAPGKTSVLLQQANGQFGPARSTDVEETPIGIAAVNFNCDGRDDLVVANFASNTVSVLQSNGDGTFSNPQTLPVALVGRSPIAVGVADLDRDGIQDLVVANTVAPAGQPNIHLFRGSCTGPFVAFAGGTVRVGELASALVVRDFTGDQLVDVAVVSQTSNSVYLARGAGDGTVTVMGSDSVSRMPIAIAAGDFDSDGRYDAVSANNDPSANNVSVLSNCARDPGCHPFGQPGPPGAAARRGDANDDGVRSAADLVAVAAEVMDGDGYAIEDIGRGSYTRAALGVDANGDGRVDAQDRVAVVHRIFGGG